jgi:two-component system sensor histidine kinase KdpD
MLHPADRFFYVFTAGLVVLGVGTVVAYSARGPGISGMAITIVLVAVVAGRVLGLPAGVSVSFVLPFLVGMVSIWPVETSWWWSGELLDLVILALVSAGCASYVATLGRHADRAAAAQADVSAAAQLGVGLVPQALDERALGQLLGSMEAMVGASCIVLFVPDDAGRLLLAQDGLNRDVCGGSLRIAQLIFDAARSNPAPSGADAASVITATADMYLPVVSGARCEGVLYAGRAEDSTPWEERNVGIVSFAADLLGALIERERLQTQASHAEAMEEADALKANILLSISHDLRTPLAAANATVASLRDAAQARGDEETEEDLSEVMEDLSALDWRIGELIDLSRLEAASWKPNIDWNDLSDLCNFVLSAAGERASTRVRCVVPPHAPPFRFDLVQLGRAVHHLVENALTYSPAGSEVKVEIAYDDETVWFSVTDQGSGLKPGEQDAVFEKFRRGSAGQLVPHGSGLGLAIASNIVAVHHGRIEVENTEPAGARFTITVPRDQEGRQ